MASEKREEEEEEEESSEVGMLVRDGPLERLLWLRNEVADGGYCELRPVPVGDGAEPRPVPPTTTPPPTPATTTVWEALGARPGGR